MCLNAVRNHCDGDVLDVIAHLDCINMHTLGARPGVHRGTDYTFSSGVHGHLASHFSHPGCDCDTNGWWLCPPAYTRIIATNHEIN